MTHVTHEGESSRPLIYERISRVMADMEAVGKAQKNAQQGWSFRSIDQLKNASNPVFAKHQVFYTPEVIEHIKTLQEAKSGSKMTHHEIKVRYKICTIDGSCVEATVYGEAADSGDKGLGKAQTYAEKVMLIQVLNVPTEEQAKEDTGLGGDPDRESHEFIPPSTKTLPASPKPQIPAPQQPRTTGTISGPQANRLHAKAKYYNWTDPELKKLMATYGYTHSKDIQYKHYDEIIQKIEKGSL